MAPRGLLRHQPQRRRRPRGLAHRDHPVLRQRLGRLRRAVPRQVLRAGVQAVGQPAQQLGDQVRQVRWRRAHIAIDLADLRGLRAVRHVELAAHVRVRFEKDPHHMADEGGAELRVGQQREPARHPVRELLHLGARRFQPAAHLAEQPLAACEERTPGFRRRDAARAAQQQLGTQQFFQSRELPAQRGLRHARQALGLGEAAALHHEHEGLDQREVDATGAHESHRRAGRRCRNEKERLGMGLSSVRRTRYGRRHRRQGHGRCYADSRRPFPLPHDQDP
ncbi:hypothetical protein FQZ97_603820 [compost metagenome]